MVATKGHVCREPGQINYGQAPPFISTNMGSWRTPLNSNRDGFSVYPQFTAASCCIQGGPRSSKTPIADVHNAWKIERGGGCRLKYFSCTGSPPLGGGYGIIMGWLWDDYGMIVGLLWDDYGMIMGWLWDDYGMIMGLLWDDYGMIMGLLLD